MCTSTSYMQPIEELQEAFNEKLPGGLPKDGLPRHTVHVLIRLPVAREGEVLHFPRSPEGIIVQLN